MALLRLDVKYHTSINVAQAANAYIPAWADFGGMHDRMFMGLNRYAKVWATERFSQVKSYLDEV